MHEHSTRVDRVLASTVLLAIHDGDGGATTPRPPSE